MRLAKFIGKIVLFLASMAIITAVSLFVVGAYLTTWPIMRLSPRNQKTQALIQVAVSLMAVARAFSPDGENIPEGLDKMYSGTD